ncbi:ubiquitin carboxyl-terminal hydrolase [Umbelopsis sp. WA50703]
MEAQTKSSEWLETDISPGSLTELCKILGAKGVQVEELMSADMETLDFMSPVFGFTFLVHYTPNKYHKDDMVVVGGDIYFANQLVNNACSTQAILSILLNCADVLDIGEDLQAFRESTKDYSPLLKGAAIRDENKIRSAHNSLSSRRELIPEESRKTTEIEDDAMFHYVSYVPVSGYIWELDGLKRGPGRIAPLADKSWLDVAGPELQRKMELYSKSRINFTLLAVIKSRALVYEDQLQAKRRLKRAIESKLDVLDPEWRSKCNFSQWEEEFHFTISEIRKQYHGETGLQPAREIIEDLAVQGASPDSPTSEGWTMPSKTPATLRTREEYVFEENMTLVANSDDPRLMMDMWLQIQEDCVRLHESIAQEEERISNRQRETSRRQRPYTEFINAFLTKLHRHGHLHRLLSQTLQNN